MMKEEWLPVPGWTKYEVSNLGRLRRDGRILKLNKRKDKRSQGYWFAGLSDRKRKVTVKIDCLVLCAFVGPRPPGQLSRHLDDDNDNNRLTNLAWGTRLENAADAIRNGRMARGIKVNTNVLTPAQVREIRKIATTKTISNVKLSRRYGVCSSTIDRIIRRENWKYLED